MVFLPVKDSQGCSSFGWKQTFSETRPLLVIFPRSMFTSPHFQTNLKYLCSPEHFPFVFPSNTGCRLKYKVLFPLKSLRKSTLFPLDKAVIWS